MKFTPVGWRRGRGKAAANAGPRYGRSTIVEWKQRPDGREDPHERGSRAYPAAQRRPFRGTHPRQERKKESAGHTNEHKAASARCRCDTPPPPSSPRRCQGPAGSGWRRCTLPAGGTTAVQPAAHRRLLATLRQPGRPRWPPTLHHRGRGARPPRRHDRHAWPPLPSRLGQRDTGPLPPAPPPPPARP